MSNSTATALTQTELALMLAELVSTDDRPPMWHDATAFITNGHTLFIVDNVDQLVDWALWEGDRWANTKWHIGSPATLRKFVEQKYALPNFTLPAIEPHPSWANPREMVEISCGECHGIGKVTCEYDHEHECPECDGEGKTKYARIYVEYLSKGKVTDQALETPAGHFQERYLWMVGKIAEHRHLSYGAFPNRLCFSFEGGSGAIMKVDIRR